MQTWTAIFLIDDSSEKGCNIVTPGGSFVSNIVCANLSISFSSSSHLLKVPMPSSLQRKMNIPNMRERIISLDNDMRIELYQWTMTWELSSLVEHKI